MVSRILMGGGALAATALVLFIGSASAERNLKGAWCMDSEDVVITFLAGDSVSVTSSSEEGVNGRGTVAKQDTMFVATIAGDELEIKMGYRYEWVTDSTIEAQTLFLTVNGDSVNTPEDAVMMRRCDTGDKKTDTKAGK